MADVTVDTGRWVRRVLLITCLVLVGPCAGTALAKDPAQTTRDWHILKRWTAAWNLLVWPTGSTLSGCFFLGERTQRQAVVAAANDWGTAANLVFDFGATPSYRDCDAAQPSLLRVAFRPDIESRTGTGTLMQDLPPLRPNLFLGVGERGQRTLTEIRDSATHEIGHVLGLPHEHQHPASPCPGQFRIEAVCEQTVPLSSEGSAKMDRAATLAMLQSQVQLRSDPPTAANAVYDVASVMHYRFPAVLLKDGPESACHSSAQRVISTGDQAKIRHRYPASAELQKAFILAQGPALADALHVSGLTAEAAHRLAATATAHVGRVFPAFAFAVPLEAAQFIAAVSADPASGGDLRDSNQAAQCQPRAP